MKNSYLKFIAVTVFYCLCWGEVRGQCPTTPLVLSTQEQVDSFPINYPNCDELTATFTITGTINSLDSLIQIKKCQDIYIKQTTELKLLKGLNNLIESKNIYIDNNPILEDISDIKLKKTQILNINFNPNIEIINCLDSINQLGSLYILRNNKLNYIKCSSFPISYLISLAVSNNPSLLNIDDLEISKNINNISISNNGNLKSIEFFKLIDSTNYYFRVTNNPSLLSFDLSNAVFGDNPVIDISNNLNLLNCKLPSNFSSINIQNNPKLINITGQSGTHCVSIKIINNTALQDIDFIKGVKNLFEDLEISGNSSLSNIDGLTNLKAASKININNNTSLTHLFGLDSLSRVSKSIIIKNNESITDLFSSNGLKKSFSTVIINNNQNLKSITPSFLNSISILLTITNNAKLESIEMDSLRYANSADVVIENNSVLEKILAPNLIYLSDLSIVNNPMLSKLSFKSLGKMNDLVIKENPSLKTLNGFDILKETSSFDIVDNDNLIDLNEFKKLKTIWGRLNVSDNEKITSFFNTSINVSTFKISNNPQLTDISSLANSDFQYEYTISNNPKLTKCAILSICNSLDKAFIKNIYNNGPNCETLNAMNTECQNPLAKLYPNPAFNTISFSNTALESNATITVYDIYGRQVFYKLTAQPELDISALSNGTYILEVKSDKINYTKKFVKY